MARLGVGLSWLPFLVIPAKLAVVRMSVIICGIAALALGAHQLGQPMPSASGGPASP